MVASNPRNKPALNFFRNVILIPYCRSRILELLTYFQRTCQLLLLYDFVLSYGKEALRLYLHKPPS